MLVSFPFSFFIGFPSLFFSLLPFSHVFFYCVVKCVHTFLYFFLSFFLRFFMNLLLLLFMSFFFLLFVFLSPFLQFYFAFSWFFFSFFSFLRFFMRFFVLFLSLVYEILFIYLFTFLCVYHMYLWSMTRSFVVIGRFQLGLTVILIQKKFWSSRVVFIICYNRASHVCQNFATLIKLIYKPFF